MALWRPFSCVDLERRRSPSRLHGSPDLRHHEVHRRRLRASFGLPLQGFEGRDEHAAACRVLITQDTLAIMDHAAIIEAIRDILRPHAGELVAAYVFGSVARGSAGPRSDIDLALLYAHVPEPGLAGLGFDVAFDVERRLSRQVDVVVLNGASPDLIHRVLRDGVVVMESDRRARVDFEVRSRAQYFDLAPLRRLYRRTTSAGSPSAPRPQGAP